MNKKNNRKGFTIVELVIVIAVIAILATVLVPTFGNIIADAKESAAKQEAKSFYTNYVSATAKEGAYLEDVVVIVDGVYYVTIVDGGVTGCYTADTLPKGNYVELKLETAANTSAYVTGAVTGTYEPQA